MDYNKFLAFHEANENWEESKNFGFITVKLLNFSKLSKFYNKNPDLTVCPFTYDYRLKIIDVPNIKLLLNSFQNDDFNVKKLSKLTNYSERKILMKMNKFKKGKPIQTLPKSLPFW